MNDEIKPAAIPKHKVGIIYHADCIDGYTAYWVAYSYLARLRGHEIIGLPMSYNDPFDKAMSLAEEVDELYILDFSFPRMRYLEQLAAACEHVTLLDHHEKAFEHLAGCKLCEVGDVWSHSSDSLAIRLDSTRSGAAIAGRYFYPNQKVPMLVQYVSDYDTWKFKLGKDTTYIDRVLRAADKTIDMWDSLNYQIEEESHEGRYALLKQGKAVQQYHEQLVSEALKHATHITIAGVEGLATNCSMDLNSDVGHELAKRSGTFGAVWQQQCDSAGSNTVKWSLRSVDAAACNVNELAANFGGGGHACAAGFYLYPAHMQGDVQLYSTGADEEESE